MNKRIRKKKRSFDFSFSDEEIHAMRMLVATIRLEQATQDWCNHILQQAQRNYDQTHQTVV